MSSSFKREVKLLVRFFFTKFITFRLNYKFCIPILTLSNAQQCSNGIGYTRDCLSTRLFHAREIPRCPHARIWLPNCQTYLGQVRAYCPKNRIGDRNLFENN